MSVHLSPLVTWLLLGSVLLGTAFLIVRSISEGEDDDGSE